MSHLLATYLPSTDLVGRLLVQDTLDTDTTT